MRAQGHPRSLGLLLLPLSLARVPLTQENFENEVAQRHYEVGQINAVLKQLAMAWEAKVSCAMAPLDPGHIALRSSTKHSLWSPERPLESHIGGILRR